MTETTQTADAGTTLVGPLSAGDGLPAALCAAAAEVIIEKGLGAFSLREVARRAGVSHAAPGYHFGDLRGLLTALATQGMQGLYCEMQAASDVDDPVERLTSIGRAYVRVAMANPAHCEVIWREDLINVDDVAYQEAGANAFGVLEDTIRGIAEAHNPDMVVDDATKLCWSTMQGLVELRPKLTRLGELHDNAVPVEELVERFTRLLVAGMVSYRPDDQASQRS